MGVLICRGVRVDAGTRDAARGRVATLAGQRLLTPGEKDSMSYQASFSAHLSL